MKIYVKDVGGFCEWLETRGIRYAVMYGGANMGEVPKRGGKWSFGVVVDRAALRPHLTELMGEQTSRLWGVECNIYVSESVDGGHDYGCFHQLPPTLVEVALTERQRWEGGYYVASDQDAYDLMLYYIAYIEAESGGVAAFDSSTFKGHRWHGFLSGVAERLGLASELSLMDMHRYLHGKGYAISYRLACSCVQRQFIAGLKSEFYAHLFREMDGRGEMNYIVLRSKAVRKGFKRVMLEELARHYEIVMVKDIPFRARHSFSHLMRGNKWRWGGRPAVSVIVFDPEPKWLSDEERTAVHPLVFNSRQFFKPALRERIVKEGRLHRKDNALHSTDNEAEAVGHLNLFFTRAEEEEIYDAIAQRRDGMEGRSAWR